MDKIIAERLERKKAELKKEQEYFSVMCHNEINTGNFEKNAINVLLVLQQLKSEISELEHLNTICNIRK